MDRLADHTYDIALAVALWTTGVGLGLSSNATGFIAPLRETWLLARIIALDVIIVPLMVAGLSRLVDVPTDAAVGLTLVGIASAGPLSIIATRTAGADTRAAVSFVIVLEAANALAIPIWVAVLLPEGVIVSPGRVIVTLAALIIAPLAVGAALRRSRGHAVERWSGPLATISNLLVLVIILVIIVRDGSEVVAALSNGVVTVAAISVLAALALGWLVGGPVRSTRIVAALVTGVRANGLALAIAQASFPDRPAIIAAIVTFGVFSAVLPLTMAYALLRVVRNAVPGPGNPGSGVPQARG